LGSYGENEGKIIMRYSFLLLLLLLPQSNPTPRNPTTTNPKHQKFIVANTEHAGTYSAACQANATFSMPCTTVETACSTRPALVAFFLRAHHNVDTHNKPCKPLWSREQAAETFAKEPFFCATAIVDARFSLCRSSGGGGSPPVVGSDEERCVTLTTSPPCGEL
jgi:hypothetical protein